MKLLRLRFLLTLVLFGAWIGLLAYLVFAMKSSLPPGATRPLVLSRPQFLVSSLDIIADVEGIASDPAAISPTASARIPRPLLAGGCWAGRLLLAGRLRAPLARRPSSLLAGGRSSLVAGRWITLGSAAIAG